MNSLSDSLLTPLTGSGTRGQGPLVLGEGVSADGPGAGEQGASGGFAAVLGRVQDGRSVGEAGAPSNAGVSAQPAVGANGEALSAQARLDAGGVPDGAGRQGMAAAFAAQWAALLPGSEGQPGSTAAAGLGQRPMPGAGVGALASLAAADGGGLGWRGAAGGEGLSGLGTAQAEPLNDGAVSEAQAAAGALAATAAAMPFMPVPAVVAVQISPQLSVITAGQATASDESLRAYAAAQGFDAAALQRMFGAGAAPAGWQTAGLALGAAAGTAAGAVAGASPSGSAVPGASAWWAATVPTATDAAAAGLVASGGPSAVPEGGAQTGAQTGALLGLTATMLASASSGKNLSTVAIGVPNGNKSSDSLAEALERFNADGGRMLVGRGDSSAASGPSDVARQLLGAGLGSASGLGPSAGQASGLSGAAGMAAAATSGWWALQAREGFLSGAGLNTAPLAAAGTLEAVDAAPALAGGDATALPTPSTPSAADPAAPVHKAQSATHARTEDAQPVDLRDHLEQSHEALSKRLGEALAARMLAQIEKGDWQIRLSVAPAHLGPIDIDLQMRGQRIDAQFQVAHGQTQALIQDGLPRLREAVGASGMDLASVWVSGGWNERNRGNPTPGQPNDPALSALNEGGGDEPEVNGAPAVDSRGLGRAPRPGGVDILI